MAVLEVVDLRKGFRSPDGAVAPIVAVGAFALAAGEQVALHGGSGSGKTTFLHLLAGVLTADAGRIRVAGHDITALGEPARDRVHTTMGGTTMPLTPEDVSNKRFTPVRLREGYDERCPQAKIHPFNWRLPCPNSN